MSPADCARVLFLIDKQAHCDRFGDLLSDMEIDIDWRWIKDIESFKKIHAKETTDILLYWHQRDIVDENALAKVIAETEQAPILILVADQVNPRDFIRAAACHAADVINAGMPAQFAFVIRRELASVRTRRQLEVAIDQITNERIVDESQLDTHVADDMGDMGDQVKCIDDALRNDGFELLFQPIVAVQDDGCENYEVFLRLKKGQELEGATNFLPIAEQYGLMPAIDRWVVMNAVKRYKAEEQVRKIRNKTDRMLRFYINISGHSLIEDAIMSDIVKEIIGAKLAPGSFVIEVDKKTVLNRLQLVKSLNQNMKKLKLEFAIDHYEKADNALNYLKHIQLDYLKLNKSIMADIHSDQSKSEEVREILRKARENEIKVIACQVENAAALPKLYELGVDYIQGYVLAEPSTKLEHPMMDDTIEPTSTVAALRNVQ